MSPKTYDFFLTSPNAKNHEHAEFSHTLTLDQELAVNDYFTGQVLQNYSVDYVRYYFKVIFIKKNSIYYFRAFEISRPITGGKKIPLLAIHTSNAGFILRDAVPKRKIKFRRETKTRKMRRGYCCCRAA
jgi:hypothetical protein